MHLTQLSTARRGVLTVIGGTAGGQILALLGAPVLSRLYAPDVFGPFAIINSLVLPFGSIVALRYELAIPLPRSQRTTRQVAQLGLMLSTFLGALGLCLTALIAEPVARWLSLRPGQEPLLLWVAIIGGLVGAFAVLNQLAIRNKMYGAIARRNLLLSAATVVVQIAAGVAGYGPGGLALGLALGQLVSVASLGWTLRDQLSPFAGLNALEDVAGRFRSFPLLLAPSGLLNSLGIQAPVLLVAAFYGPSVSGWLGMTQRVLSIPLALVGQAVAQVFLGEFGAARRAGSADLQRLFMRATRNLFAVGIVGLVAILLLAPWGFETFLGHQWRESGIYAQAMGVSLMMQMVGNPLSQTIIVMGRNAWQLGWDAVRFVLCAGAVVGAHATGGLATTAIWWLGAASAVSYALVWLLARAAITSRR